jgi:hypothetical protein
MHGEGEDPAGPENVPKLRKPRVLVGGVEVGHYAVIMRAGRR